MYIEQKATIYPSSEPPSSVFSLPLNSLTALPSLLFFLLQLSAFPPRLCASALKSALPIKGAESTKHARHEPTPSHHYGRQRVLFHGGRNSNKADSCPICGCPVNKTGIAITEATKKTDKKSPNDVAIGARFLVGIFIVLIIIIGACRNQSKTPVPTKAIKAGINDFKSAIPILQQHPVEKKERDSRIDYSWSHIVLSGEKNTVVMYDDDKNGTVDSILFCFSLSQKNKTG